MAIQTKYEDQLNRVRRWYQRFREINEGKLHDRPSDFYQDEVYAFFMNCYHLKDWIRNDPSGSSIAGKVEGYINTTPELSLCADICNGLKHLTLTTHRSGEKPEFGPRKFEVGIGAEPTTIAAHYTINTDSGPIDAFNLATKCLEAWEKLLA